MTEIVKAPDQETGLAPKDAQPTPPPPIKQYSLEDVQKLAAYLSTLGEGLYPLIRAMDGLPPEDDPTYGLIDRTDKRQTTMLTQDGEDTHVAWEVAGKAWPWLDMFEKIRESDVAYSKTIDGKNWVLTAALVGKAQQQGPSTQINMGTPQFNTPNWNPQQTDQNGNPTQQGPPKKKKRFGLF